MRVPPFPRSPFLRRALSAAAFVAALLLVLHWSPERQVALHQAHFLRAVEDRSWEKAARFVAPDYRDRWGQTKAILMARLPQVFGTFFACGVQGEPSSQSRQGDISVVQARIRIVGSGGPIAQFVMQQVEALKEPFAFRWQRQSWKPWDWKLVEINQPEIVIPPDTDL